jgi:hypothetical protein
MLIRTAGSLCAALVVIAAVTACAGEDPDLEATARCSGTTVELRFDPAGSIRVETGGRTVAEADAGGRRLAFDVCPRARTQRGWGTGSRYTRTDEPVILSCRLDKGFFVHVHPTSSSESGELSPDGSAVYLTIKTGAALPLIVASAVVDEREARSTLTYSRRFCVAGGEV